MAKRQSRLPTILKKYEGELLDEWIREIQSSNGKGRRLEASDLRMQAQEVLRILQEAAIHENLSDTTKPEWELMRRLLDEISRSRALQGFGSDETALFIFALKKPLFERLQKECVTDSVALTQETWIVSDLIDKLGLHTVKAFQKTREDVIRRQQEELLELSTPVVKLWDGVLALPMIGTLDSARTQVVMESLLQRIVETGSEIAIIDMTWMTH
jgi:rsbT co-antagonist protein RsbR